MEKFQFCSPEFAGGSFERAKTLFQALKIVRLLGKGGLGKVELCHDAMSNCLLAVKTVHINNTATHQRASKEAIVVRRLGHPLMLPYRAAVVIPDTEGGGTFLKLVMAYLPGASLMEILRARRGTGLPEESVKVVIAQVVAALQHVHQHGYVYVDLKPENILIVSSEETSDPQGSSSLDPGCSFVQQFHADAFPSQPSIRLIDFDLCHEIAEKEHRPPCLPTRETLSNTSQPDESHSNGPHFWGTIDYVAPEVGQAPPTAYTLHHMAFVPCSLSGSAASPLPGDLNEISHRNRSVGILTYELLYGRPPFAGPDMERTCYNISMKAPQFPSDPEISTDCQYFIRSLLRQRVDVRLGSKQGAKELLQHRFLSATAPSMTQQGQ